MNSDEQIWTQVVDFLDEEDFLSRHPGIGKKDFERFVKEGFALFGSPKKTVKAVGKKVGEKSHRKFTVHSDGAARGNPGPAGIGVAIYHEGEIIWEGCQALGKTTNNVAEYEALIWGVEQILSFEPQSVHFKLDSQLVVNQIKGVYRVKSENLAHLYKKAKKLLKKVPKWEISHIPRKENAVADRLANQALDEAATLP